MSDKSANVLVTSAVKSRLEISPLCICAGGHWRERWKTKSDDTNDLLGDGGVVEHYLELVETSRVSGEKARQSDRPNVPKKYMMSASHRRGDLCMSGAR